MRRFLTPLFTLQSTYLLNPELFIPETTPRKFATVILPIAIRKEYTYSVPSELEDLVRFGVRVEVSFGKNKLYAGIIQEVHEADPGYKTKPILSVIDEVPVVTQRQLRLWKWISNYYACTLGEVMNAALPSGLKLMGETRIILSSLYDENEMASSLSDNEYLIAEALQLQNELRISDVKKILNRKTIYPIIKSLLDKRVIFLYEELKEKFKPKTISCIRFREPYASDPSTLAKAFDLTARSRKQTEALLAYVQLSKKQEVIRRQEIYNTATGVDAQAVKELEKKGIIEIYHREVSRLGGYEEETVESFQLSNQQEKALTEIRTTFEDKDVLLLHGVTGSGKTRVYIELIQEAIDKGQQVLYLLPEIALTTQIVHRLQKIFGNDIIVYHSRMNNNERVELWKSAQAGKPILLGARSGMFLPFQNLGLIIVDEEHDPSFKQHEPAPRYNARDTAVVLSALYGAKVVLGTATPSLETYRNATTGKYGLVEMPERFGGLEMPEIVIVDQREEMKNSQMHSHFTSVLLEELKTTLDRGEQAILFQNRRGYAPTLRCHSCGWHSECVNCDVSLTYHKFSDHLRCHYCGYLTGVPTSCPACGHRHLDLKGFGTEKIEDELKVFLPSAKIGRMDWDTVKGKHAHAKLINDFEEKRIDILVGTQMVTKGLDFDNVSVVGILSADHLIRFPDFRAGERAFQLMIQVSGRAGRKKKRGKVIIQAYEPDHPVIKEVIDNDFKGFVKRESMERKEFLYPPYYRIIKITLKHKKRMVVQQAAEYFGNELKMKFKGRVIGPAEPGVPRVRGFYLMNIVLKLNKDAKDLKSAKDLIWKVRDDLGQTKGFTSVKIIVDVDSY